MSGNGGDLRQALAQSLEVEPALSRDELELHSTDGDQHTEEMRQRMEELLHDAPAKPMFNPLTAPLVKMEIADGLRAAFEEALRLSMSMSDAETQLIRDLGMEKLGEFRTSIRGHLSGAAELADPDLAIYVERREGRKSAFQRALEENLKDLTENPPLERGSLDLSAAAEAGLQEAAEEIESRAEPLGEKATERDATGSREHFDTHEKSSFTIGSKRTSATAVSYPSAIAPAAGPTPQPTRMPPVPLLTAALEAAGFAEDEFGFVLRFGRYAQSGRESEFLVGGLGLSDLSDRLAGWLEAQGADDCEVQVLDDGSGELMIYLLGQDQPIPSPEIGFELE